MSSCAVKQKISNAKPIEHTLWDSLLQDHVDVEGWVDYRGFQQDSMRLNAYLNILSQHHPNEQHWTKEEQLAYWINAYNAFTVKIVSDHYPVAGIKE
ncbi:MAG: DUF547 domain-containing protein, partial [Saprospiraceae bacterium]|nr:DUF547 domain-containing protein [Saprospiraceae bacterium]